MKTIFTLFAVVMLAVGINADAGGRKRVGATPCNACTNCSNCGFCKSGGTCGTCAKPGKKSASAVAAPISATSVSATGIHCGTWRWDVKTLSDPLAKKTLLGLTKELDFDGLLQLDNLVLPQGGNTSMHRQADETLIKVTGRILKYKIEPDNDYHVILTNGRYFIVCEIPSPTCDGAIQSGLSAEYSAARKIVESLPGKKLKGWFEVEQSKHNNYIFTGAAFHDFKHGARFTMPNCLEIHPVIKIEPIL